MTDASTVGQRLKQARKIAGLRQQDVAAKLGLNQSVQVSQWESGVYSPNADNLDRLASLYGTSTSWLLRGTGKAPVRENVPRGTTAADSAGRMGGAHAQRRERAIALEREMLRAGATDEDANYIGSRAQAFMESVLSSGGTDLDLTEGELDAEFDAYLDNLRTQIKKRIELRKRGKAR